PSHSMPRR
ncbi:hypothetical protein VN97_g7928, partial [Penicillium thymicola]